MSTTITHEVNKGLRCLRCLPLNDVCVLGARAPIQLHVKLQLYAAGFMHVRVVL